MNASLDDLSRQALRYGAIGETAARRLRVGERRALACANNRNLGVVLFVTRERGGGLRALYGLYVWDAAQSDWTQRASFSAPWPAEHLSRCPAAPGAPLIEVCGLGVARYGDDNALAYVVPGLAVEGVETVHVRQERIDVQADVGSNGAFIAVGQLWGSSLHLTAELGDRVTHLDLQAPG